MRTPKTLAVGGLLLLTLACGGEGYIPATIEREVLDESAFGTTWQIGAKTADGYRTFVFIGSDEELRDLDSEYGPGDKVYLYGESRAITADGISSVLVPEQIRHR